MCPFLHAKWRVTTQQQVCNQIAVVIEWRICKLRVGAAALVIARLAQPAERKALNLVVVGSSPTVGAFRLHTRSHAQRACTHISAGTHVDVQRHTDTQTHRRTPSHTEPQGRHAHIIQDVTG